jgi:PilZ domain
MYRSFARGLARFLKSEDGTIEREGLLSRFDFVVWAPAVVAALCTPLVYLASRLGRRHGLPAPPGWRQGAEGAQPADPFRDGGRSERRSSLRRGGTHLSVLLSDAEAEVGPVRGVIIDRSTGGLSVAVDEPVRLGEVLSVRVAASAHEMPWVQVTVRHFRREGSYYLMGCQFRRPQPWSVLLLFG